nr:DUF4062 domain-containing protein [Paenibacillus sp. A3]
MAYEKKLQIYISSTFADLVAERQIAVEAILKAGHIPAGIGIDPFFLERPMDTIKRWIDESDVFITIRTLWKHASRRIEELSALGI